MRSKERKRNGEAAFFFSPREGLFPFKKKEGGGLPLPVIWHLAEKKDLKTFTIKTVFSVRGSCL